MILRNVTIKYKGYDPDTLTKGSHKRVCCVCDECGRVRWVGFRDYRTLCKSCSSKNKIFDGEYRKKLSKNHFDCSGKNNPNYGISPSIKTRIKRSCAHQKINIEDFDGFTSKIRNHVLLEKDCIKLNSRFNNSEFHHITKSIGIYIPKELHHHFYHNLKIGINMGSMNMLALQFINGGL